MTEDALQTAIIEYVRYQPIEGVEWFHAIPNGARTSISVAKRLKRTGLKKGVLDLCWPCRKGKYSGFKCEVKVGKNKPSKEQREYAAWCKSQGFYTCLVYDLDNFIKHFNNFLKG